ncbi:MAG: DUF1800 domain-containing protein [Phycisphaerae bacterium]
MRRNCSATQKTLTAALVFAALVSSPVLAQPGRNALAPLPADQWDTQAAAHLLRRAGFGGTPAQIAELAKLGLNGAVDSLIEFQQTEYDCPPPPIESMTRENPADPKMVRALSEAERQEFQQKQRQAERRTFEETRLWWIERMATSPRPLEERMTLFWHGHFTSGFREVKRAVFMKEQNDLLRKYALGNFRDLVLGVSKDRAMLAYLDGVRNVKGAPNENYARELMELFTLGVGNYTETDVKAAARAFTGWGFDEDGFAFRARLHDSGVKNFLGRSGNFDGADIVDIILEQPACARYLARRLLLAFVRPDPDQTLVEALAREIQKNKYELRPTLRTLFRSQAFYHPDSRGCLVKSPTQLLVGLSRELDIPINNLVAAERALVNMGQELMQPPNVKGWPGGSAWINTATLYARYNVLGGMINGAGGELQTRAVRAALGSAPSDDNKNDEEKMMAGGNSPKSRLNGGAQTPFDPIRWLGGTLTAEDTVDAFTAYLLASRLAPGKRDQLVHYLADGGALKSDDKATQQRLRTMVHLLCSTPEYQLY